MTTAITPFTANVPQEVLDDLQERLARTRFARELPGMGTTQGLPEGLAREWVERWRTSFDWRAWEAKLNAYPQFTTEIDGQSIFFLHIRSAVETATPLLLIHGWPGSVLEFLDVIGPLTDPVAHGGTEADAFHLVIPAIPGYGFSGPISERWSLGRMARAFVELMDRLGYETYGTQGGDFGAFLAPEVARQAPDKVTGIHINAATYGFIPWGEVSDGDRAAMTDLERERLARLANWNAEGSGYFQIMATKPQTIAYGLTDSPVGLLAWIGEKFRDWSFNPEGLPGGAIDPDVILAHATLYWVTETAGSSARTYWEAMHTEDWPGYLTTPLAVAAFAEDVAIRQYGESGYHIAQWSDFDRGGHFAALEAPNLLVGDIRTFFAKVRAGIPPVEPPSPAGEWG